MDQKQIKNLLVEASGHDCRKERLEEIFSQLWNETKIAKLSLSGHWLHAGEDIGTTTILQSLWKDCLTNRQEAMLSLFPIFALLCGNRTPAEEKRGKLPKIEWNLLNQPSTS